MTPAERTLCECPLWAESDQIDAKGGEPTVGLRHGSRGNTGKAVTWPVSGEPGAKQREGQ